MNAMNENDETLNGFNAKYMEIGNASLPFFLKHFDGNKFGKITFGLEVPEEWVDELISYGWNVQLWTPNNPDYPPFHWLSVEARFDNYPPKIWTVTGNKVVEITKDTVSTLQSLRFSKVHVKVSNHHYEVFNKVGNNTFLRELIMFVETSGSIADRYPQLFIPQEEQ